ncbi:MAG: glycosyltransferase [Planctomycetota bacterium]
MLLVIESCRPSGLATQAEALACGLRGLSAAGEGRFTPSMVALQARGAVAEKLAGVGPLEAAGRRHAADPIAAWKLRRAIRTQRPTVVHAWGPAAAAYAAAACRMIGRSQGRPALVATLGRPATHTPAWRLSLDAWRRRQTAWTIATSEAVAERLGSTIDRVILPGVFTSAGDKPDRSASKAELRQELGLPPTARVIAIAARLLPRKRVKEMIWVADLLRVVRDETRLVVIGGGPELPVLQRFARLASTAEHIRFTGPRGDAAELVRGADALWHAGDEHAPPLAVLEAMAAGVPVVADATPGARRAVTHDQTGLLVEPGQRAERVRQTERLLDDPALRDRLTAAAAQSVRTHFSAERMTAEYAAVYHACAEPGPP